MEFMEYFIKKNKQITLYANEYLHNKKENYFKPMMCSVYEKNGDIQKIKLNLNAFFAVEINDTILFCDAFNVLCFVYSYVGVQCMI